MVAERPVNVTRAAIETALSGFRGEIQQIPPLYSAIKQGGQRLYALARAGIEVDRPPRRVVIHELRLLDWCGDRLELEVSCSKGTYIRSLAHDLGEILGCGGHVVALRRLAMGGFVMEQAISLEALKNLPENARLAQLIPGDQALGRLPAVELSVNAAYYLCQGQIVTAPHGHGPGVVRLYDGQGGFLGLGEILLDGRVAPKRLLQPAKQADSRHEIG